MLFVPLKRTNMWVPRLLIFAAALLAGAPAARCEERPDSSPEALTAAQELFAVTFERAGTQLNAQAVDHTWPSIENALRARNPDLDAATIAGLKQEFERIRLAKLRAVIKDLPQTYARHLTPQEMREIAAFYRTPTGTKLMQVVPSVVGEVFAIVLPAMPSVVNDTHEEFLRLARERGHIK
jgi:uncharacterized protein